MSIKRTATRNVDPRLAAVAILVVLGVIQYVWWQGLVAKRKSPSGAPRGGNSMNAGNLVYLVGLPDARVDTIAGAQQPGDEDGVGRVARFDGPTGIGLDSAGRIYVADSRNNRIRVVAPDGRTRTLAGREAGFRDGSLSEARFNAPTGIAVTPDGVVYVTDTNNHRIRRIQGDQVTTVAGSDLGMADGPGAAARFNLPTALAWRSVPNQLLIADSGNRRIRQLMIMAGTVSVGTVQSMSEVPGWVAVGPSGMAMTLPDQGTLDLGLRKLKDLEIDAQENGGRLKPGEMALHRPVTVAAAPEGWYVADATHSALFLVRGGRAEVVAGMCQNTPERVAGLRDGPGDKAEFGLITGIASDKQKHVFVADSANNSIRRITLPGGDTGTTRATAPRRWRPGDDEHTVFDRRMAIERGTEETPERRDRRTP